MADTKWTLKKIRKLGATTDVETAAEILNIGRTVAYELAKADKFPVPVLRIGAMPRYVIPVAPIIALLFSAPKSEPKPDGVAITLSQREADVVLEFIRSTLTNPDIAHRWSRDVRYLNATMRKIIAASDTP